MKYKNCTIKKSGQRFFKIEDENGNRLGMRVTSVEAAQALVDSRGRVMTPEEHKLVHG